MPSKADLFHNNRLFKLLSNQSIYSDELLQQLNSLLHEEPDLSEHTHPKEGSFFHIICRNSNNQENIASRMIYALSNAGADPNVPDVKGNTPLHEAFIQGFIDNKYDLIQALFRVGVDPRIVNYDRKTAAAYLRNNSTLVTALCKAYGEGVWAAIETTNIPETERLVKGFIKVDCKHNSNKSLLDKARDIGNTSIVHILADNQVTNEFFHSILAYDWERASLIYQHEKEFLKISSFDSIHKSTWFRTCSKSLLEYCLDSHSSKPFEILFNSSSTKIDVNILCTDGLPFFFHCFNENISNDIRKIIFLNANMYTKSIKGETFLFYLISLYCENENQQYLNIFTHILSNHPVLISQRNQQEQTIVEFIEFTTSDIIYKKLKPFYDSIMNILIKQLKYNSVMENLIFNYFGYYLLIFFKNKTLKMTKYAYALLRSFKLCKDLPVLISEFIQSIINDDIVKFKNILKIKSNIFYAKDSFGRTCLHLAVLYQRYDILKFICDNYNHIIHSSDNLNRTSFHYACIMNDKTSIEILQQANGKELIDCMNLYPTDYLLNRDLCCEEFHAKDFPQNELLRKSTAVSNYLKLAFYPSLKKAIEDNSIEEIKSINDDIIQMGFHLKDFNPNSYFNDYIQGERYIPLLFLALEHRSVASIQCLIQLGLPLIGQMYMSKSSMKENSRWISFCSRAEELECFDIIDIINDLDDDIELKNVFKPQSVPNEDSIKVEDLRDTNPEKLTTRQEIMNFLTRNQQNQNPKSQTCILL